MKRCIQPLLILQFAFATSLAFGQTGAALDFSGAGNNYALVNRRFPLSDFTFDFWIKTTQAGTGTASQAWYYGVGLLDADTYGYAADYGISLGAGGKLKFGTGNGSSAGDFTLTSNTAINTGAWRHVAVTRNSQIGQLSIYIDGKLDVSATSSTNTGLLNNPNTLVIGELNNNNHTTGYDPFTGQLDNIRLWNRLLCPSEIVQYMNCESPSKTPGLVLNYQFNEGVDNSTNTGITTATDSSGNGYDAVLYNFALTGTVSNWVAPGGVTSGIACVPLITTQMSVLGNKTLIPDGDFVPSTTNSTNYGLTSTSISRTFTIKNTGANVLTVSGLNLSDPNVYFTSSTSTLPQNIAVGDSLLFSITFNPNSGNGILTDTVIISTIGDCNTPTYTFLVQASAGGITTGLDKSSSSLSSLDVYPNPTDGMLFVSGLQNENITMNVYDGLGSKVLTSDETAIAGLDMSSLKQGVYFLKINQDGQSRVIKIYKK